MPAILRALKTWVLKDKAANKSVCRPARKARPGLEMLEARETSPLDQTLESETREQVRACVDKLPEFLRQVLVLVYYQGLKYREVAEILDVPVGTVKSRLHTALLKLQESWTEAPSLPEI